MTDWSSWLPFGAYVPRGATSPRPSRPRTAKSSPPPIRWHCWLPFGIDDYSSAERRSTARAQPVPHGPQLRAERVCGSFYGGDLRPAELLHRIIDKQIDPTTLPDAQLRAIARWCHARERASAQKCRSLVERGHVRKAKRERLRHLNSREVLLHALFCAARKRWKVGADMAVDEARSMRRQRLLAPFEQFENVARFGRKARGRVRYIPKNGGGVRPITSFGWVDHGRQIALKSAFKPFANLHEGQFMASRDPDRRGPAAVRKALEAALIECDADSLFVQFDIRDFHGSISHGWLEGNLGIDPKIVRRQIHTAEMLIVPMGVPMVDRGPHDASNTEKPRRGIPQGSSLSPLIAEMVMAELARSVAVFAELPSFIWSDNIGVIVPRSRVVEVEALVRSAFASHGAGPFDLRVSTRAVMQEFKFLGVWYRKTETGARPYVPASVANAAYASIAGEVITAAPQALDRLVQRIRGKAASWRWWEGVEEFETSLMALVTSARAAVWPSTQ